MFEFHGWDVAPQIKVLCLMLVMIAGFLSTAIIDWWERK
jgi:hypothetical protein